MECYTHRILARPFRPDTDMNKYLRLQYLELTNLILSTRYFNQVKKSNLGPYLIWEAMMRSYRDESIFRVQG